MLLSSLHFLLVVMLPYFALKVESNLSCFFFFFSFLSILPTLVTALPFLFSPSWWDAAVTADWQYEGNNYHLSFSPLTVCSCHCVSLLTLLTPQRWLWRITSVITAKKGHYSLHAVKSCFPYLTSFSATFYSTCMKALTVERAMTVISCRF